MAVLNKTALTSLCHCPAPAKLNLFLHVIGRRSDGYHCLESVFQLIDFCDYLDFTCRDDHQIKRITSDKQISEKEDLVIRAATLLREKAWKEKGIRVSGINIAIEKNIPMGSGLGGGSSDAATTLMALNHLWHCQFGIQELMAMGLQLGADVPFFLLGQNAFAEGIGERLTPLETPDGWFVVIKPPVSVSTAVIFRLGTLTRSTEPIRIANFPGVYKELNQFGKNDLQDAAVGVFPEISEAIEALGQFGSARMTGSGSCVFSRFSSKAKAEKVVAQLPGKWDIWVVKGIQCHPLRYLLDNKSE